MHIGQSHLYPAALTHSHTNSKGGPNIKIARQIGRVAAGKFIPRKCNAIHFINRCRLFNCQQNKSWQTRISSSSSGPRWRNFGRSVRCNRPAGGDRRPIDQWRWAVQRRRRRQQRPVCVHRRRTRSAEVVRLEWPA